MVQHENYQDSGKNSGTFRHIPSIEEAIKGISFTKPYFAKQKINNSVRQIVRKKT